MVISLIARLKHTSLNESLDPLANFCGPRVLENSLGVVTCWSSLLLIAMEAVAAWQLPSAFPIAEEAFGRQTTSLPLIPTCGTRSGKPQHGTDLAFWKLMLEKQVSWPVFTAVLCAWSVSTINQFIYFLDSRRKQSILNMMEKKKRLAAQEEISLKRQMATTPKQMQKQTVLQLTQPKENMLQKPTKLPHLLQQLKQ